MFSLPFPSPEAEWAAPFAASARTHSAPNDLAEALPQLAADAGH